MAAVLSDKAAEAASPSPPPAQFMDHHSPSLSTVNSRRSDDASDAADASDLTFLDRSSSLSSSARLSDSQSLLALRSEEYRQLFRLPADEVLIQDFNCALQESFLLQEQYSEPISQENGSLLADKTEIPDQPVDEAASVERDKEISLSDDTKPLDNGDYEIVPNPSVPPDSLEEAAEIVQSTDCSSSGKSLVLEEVNYDAPQGLESFFNSSKPVMKDSASPQFDECRDVYAIWIELAHEFLKQKKLEMEQGRCLRWCILSGTGQNFIDYFFFPAAGVHAANLIPNGQVEMEKPVRAVECKEKSDGGNDAVISQTLPDSNNMNPHPVSSPQERCTNNAPVPFLFRDFKSRFSSLLKSQNHFYVLLIVAIAVVLLLMQMSIIVLLSRPQQIHVVTQGDCMGGMHGMGERGVEALAYIDKQINHLKEEMLMVETTLHKMQNEYDLLKVKLNDFERIKKYQK
nr:protein VASCULAR ASSOCIATED DEATH 1, chloroplastic [Ipomoea batatas]